LGISKKFSFSKTLSMLAQASSTPSHQSFGMTNLQK